MVQCEIHLGPEEYVRMELRASKAHPKKYYTCDKEYSNQRKNSEYVCFAISERIIPVLPFFYEAH